MMKKTIAWVIAGVMLLPAQCVASEQSTQTYADDFITFEYSTEPYCDVYYSYSKGYFSHYSYSTDMYSDDDMKSYADIVIYKKDDFIKTFEVSDSNWKDYMFGEKQGTNSGEYSIIQDGDFPEIKVVNTGDTAFAKLIGESKDYFAVAKLVYSEDDESADYCKEVYASAGVTENFTGNGFSEPDDDFAYESIYENVIISEQGMNYVNAAIDVLEKYLSFEIDGNEAEDKIDEISKRCDKLSDTTGYIHDNDVHSTINLTGLYISMENDADVMSDLDKLKTFKAE